MTPIVESVGFGLKGQWEGSYNEHVEYIDAKEKYLSLANAYCNYKNPHARVVLHNYTHTHTRVHTYIYCPVLAKLKRMRVQSSTRLPSFVTPTASLRGSPNHLQF